MGWRDTQPALYTAPTRSAPQPNAVAESHRDYTMQEYRDYVEGVADGKWPSETILNRSSEHAAVIVENLFRKATHKMEILTSELNSLVYGLPAVIDAAIAFLGRDGAQLHILTEAPLDRKSHPFLSRLESAGVSPRMSLKLVNPKLKAEYKFNFAVADGRSFRFEESRESFEAIVGFGHDKFGNKLSAVFGELESKSV